MLTPAILFHDCSYRRHIITDSLFTTVATTPIFRARRAAALNFASPSFHRRVNYPGAHFQPRFVFFPSSIWPSLINVNVWIVAEGGHAARCGAGTPATNGGRSSGTRGYGWGWKSARQSPSSSERVGQVRDFRNFIFFSLPKENTGHRSVNINYARAKPKASSSLTHSQFSFRFIFYKRNVTFTTRSLWGNFLSPDSPGLIFRERFSRHFSPEWSG